jgi:hypothetical protein
LFYASDMLNETIAHYRILSKLGSGGMGIAYEAEDTKLGRRVTHFTSERIGAYLYSKDGAKLSVERGHSESDAVLLRGMAK